MPRVICELENASDLINGIRFTPDRGQMVSEEVDQATADYFASIPGYRLVEPPPPVQQATTTTAAPAGAGAGAAAAAPKAEKPAKPKPAAAAAEQASGADTTSGA